MSMVCTPQSAILFFCDCMVTPPFLKQHSPLRFGMLGAARIGPAALLIPAESHEDVVVTAVACRDDKRGRRYASSHKIPKAYTGPGAYQGASCS